MALGCFFSLTFPGFPALPGLCSLKTIPHCLQQITFSFKPLSIPVLIKLSWLIFYFDSICILYGRWVEAGYTVRLDRSRCSIALEALHCVTTASCQYWRARAHLLVVLFRVSQWFLKVQALTWCLTRDIEQTYFQAIDGGELILLPCLETFSIFQSFFNDCCLSVMK